MKKTLIAFTFPFALGACSSAITSDLQEFVETSGSQFKGDVKPLPPMVNFVPVPYSGASLPDPFSIPKSQEDIVQGVNAPDATRKKEFLESYGIEQLQMVGTMEKNKKIHALVKSPDGTTNVVSLGNHMGLNYGRVVEISHENMRLVEVAQDPKGIWREREITIDLSEK